MAPTPGMDQDVLDSLRLGWCMAELRGRYREQLAPEPQSAAAKFDRTGDALPLQDERSAAELAIEVEKAVVSLAAALKLSVDATGLRTATSKARDALKEDAGWPGAWDHLAGQFYSVDAAFQDELFAMALPRQAAYQLGRALAEVTWALDPSASEGPNSLTVLLGDGRVATIRRVLLRLRLHIDEVTSNAIASSVDAWVPLATGWPMVVSAAGFDHAAGGAPAIALRATVEALRNQVRVWHDLLLDQVPWRTLIDPQTAIKRRPTLAPLQPFWPDLLLGTAGLAGLVIALGLISLSGSAWTATVVALLSAAGVTAAGGRAHVKNQAQNLIGQMRRAFDMELAAQAVLRLPTPNTKTVKAPATKT